MNKHHFSCDSSIGLALGCGLVVLCLISDRGKISFVSTLSTLALGPTQPFNYCVLSAVPVRIKCPELEADHFPPSSV
jgi:hypothetical protein